MSHHLFKRHMVTLDLSGLPYEPRREGERLTFKIRDPIGAAVCLLMDPRCSGMPAGF